MMEESEVHSLTRCDMPIGCMHTGINVRVTSDDRERLPVSIAAVRRGRLVLDSLHQPS